MSLHPRLSDDAELNLGNYVPVDSAAGMLMKFSPGGVVALKIPVNVKRPVCSRSLIHTSWGTVDWQSFESRQSLTLTPPYEPPIDDPSDVAHSRHSFEFESVKSQ